MAPAVVVWRLGRMSVRVPGAALCVFGDDEAGRGGCHRVPDPAGGDAVRLFRGRDLLAQLVDALAKLTTPGEAERIQTDVSVGLGEIRARRLAATNREEVAANRRAYAALQQELLGRPGSTGTVTAAESGNCTIVVSDVCDGPRNKEARR